MGENEMNIDRLTKLAEHFEAGAPPEKVNDIQFFMPTTLEITVNKKNNEDHWCNSSGCIAGLAVAMFDMDSINEQVELARRRRPRPRVTMINFVKDRARKLLDLTNDQINNLFDPETYAEANGLNTIDLYDITHEQVGQMLRRLIETGEVNWLNKPKQKER
jgi:hypothetical protein